MYLPQLDDLNIWQLC